MFIIYCGYIFYCVLPFLQYIYTVLCPYRVLAHDFLLRWAMSLGRHICICSMLFCTSMIAAFNIVISIITYHRLGLIGTCVYHSEWQEICAYYKGVN